MILQAIIYWVWVAIASYIHIRDRPNRIARILVSLLVCSFLVINDQSTPARGLAFDDSAVDILRFAGLSAVLSIVFILVLALRAEDAKPDGDHK